MVRDELAHPSAHLVCQQHQELSTRECEYLVIGVALHLGLVPDLEAFSRLVYRCDELVHV